MTEVSGKKPVYDDSFFNYIESGSLRSASVVAPLVLAQYPASSVLDVGSGRGAWLVEWRKAGVEDIVGVDGPYIDRETVLIPKDRFIQRDLKESFRLDRRFDLVTSLEVAEHIPEGAADTFVDNIAAHGDAVMFSAAVPGQGGTFHVNEQPIEYWRAKFVNRGYRVFDFVRKGLAGRSEVEPWYRYNSLFFARGEAVSRLGRVALDSEILPGQPVPELAGLSWRLRNAVIRRLPGPVVDRLVDLKHGYVTWRAS